MSGRSPPLYWSNSGWPTQPNPTNIANANPNPPTPADRMVPLAGAWSKYTVGWFCVRLWSGFVSGYVCEPNLRNKDPWQCADSGLVLCAFYPIRSRQVKISTQSGVSKLRTKYPFAKVVTPTVSLSAWTACEQNEHSFCMGRFSVSGRFCPFLGFVFAFFVGSIYT